MLRLSLLLAAAFGHAREVRPPRDLGAAPLQAQHGTEGADIAADLPDHQVDRPLYSRGARVEIHGLARTVELN
eukprot:COSAG03_NODE_20078_length_325_cov_0.637168_1_plen_72_part_10